MIDLPHGPVTIGEALDVSGMEMNLDRQKEWWTSLTNVGGRTPRHFTDPKCTVSTGRRCAPGMNRWWPHVSHRADLTYVIGEMISELNIGHAYVGGGEMPHPQRIQMGLPCAQLQDRDKATGYYKIATDSPVAVVGTASYARH